MVQISSAARRALVTTLLASYHLISASAVTAPSGAACIVGNFADGLLAGSGNVTESGISLGEWWIHNNGRNVLLLRLLWMHAGRGGMSARHWQPLGWPPSQATLSRRG